MTTGAPDHHVAAFPIKPSQGDNQTRYITTATANITAGGSAILTITIPVNKRRIFACIDLDCEVSVIQRFKIEINDSSLFDTLFDKEKFMAFPGNGQLFGEAGEKWEFILVNQDTVTRNMRESLVGTDEDR